MIDDQVDRIRRQYGKLVSKAEIAATEEVSGVFSETAQGIDQKSTLDLAKVKSKKALSALKGKKVGDTVTLGTKGLMMEDYLLPGLLGITREQAENLDIDVSFTIEEINERQPAVLDQDLFDRLFGKDSVSSEEEMRNRIKSDSEGQFEQQSDQKLINDVTEKLIEMANFDLPAAFLKKWIQNTGEKPLTEEEAHDEFERSEKGLRYQLIEGKIIRDNNLNIQFDELKEFAKGFIRSQMAQYGQLNPKEEDLENISVRVLSNQDEVKRLSEQLMSQKLLSLYKEQANLKVKEVTYEDFVKEVYG
jgi:trigger factor